MVTEIWKKCQIKNLDAGCNFVIDGLSQRKNGLNKNSTAVSKGF